MTTCAIFFQGFVCSFFKLTAESLLRCLLVYPFMDFIKKKNTEEMFLFHYYPTGTTHPAWMSLVLLKHDQTGDAIKYW